MTTTVTVQADDTPQSDTPNVNNCVIYNYAVSDNNLTPTLYVWSEAEGVTYRVYADESGSELVGSAKTLSDGCAAVPLDRSLIGTSGGYVYVSRQAAGESESEKTEVKYLAAATPGVSMKVYRPTLSNIQNGNNPIMQSSRGMIVNSPSSLTVGSYYVVDVAMSNYTKVESLTLPIKYDPSVLQLAKLVYDSGSGGYKFSSTGETVSTGASGTLLSVFDTTSSLGTYTIGGYPFYGIGIYEGLQSWGVVQETGSSSTWAQTPYVNTVTGLVKLEFTPSGLTSGSATVGTVSATGASTNILRLYFKCTGTITSTDWSDVLHFATTDDIPSDVTELSEQQRYYCITSPEGYLAQIKSMDLLSPPLSADTSGLYSETETVVMSAAQIYALPTSLSASDDIRTLIENRVAVYNYTNYGEGNDIYGALDYPATDKLILTPSSETNGAARQGDQISVYGYEDGTLTLLAGPTEVDNEGGVVVDLGRTALNPDGGSVYVTVTRSGRESEKIEVPYGAEMSRDVWFTVNASGYTGTDGAGISADGFTVNAGDQIRIDVCFNHFSDLFGYTFDLSFNSDVVRAADNGFHVLTEDGYISETDLNLDDSCIEVGADLTGITLNEQLAYNTWIECQNGTVTADEATEIAKALGLSGLDELQAAAETAAVKLSFGDTSWNGGLLFTGPAREAGTNGAGDPGRSEDSVYPYVDNDAGVLRFASATLENPPLTMNTDGEGYHFLSIYFYARQSGTPNFRISGASTRTDGVERVISGSGTELILIGPGSESTTASTVCSMPFTAHWTAYAMDKVEKTATIRLSQGNALSGDGDLTALYLYNGYAFQDPGFLLQSASDVVLEDTESESVSGLVKRYFIRGEEIKELPTWAKGEELYDYFTIPTNGASAAYDLVYEYTSASGSTVTVIRKVYVIHPRGDLNGDGAINVFDEQMLETGETPDDALYRSKTLADSEAIHAWLMGTESYSLEYVMPVERTADTPGDGSSDESAFRIWLELYSATGAQLEPTSLPAGGTVAAVVRYENLNALTEGIVNLSLRLSYPAEWLSVQGFAAREADETVLWESEAVELNEEWVSEASPLASALLTASASDRAGSEADRREVYIQYVNTAGNTKAFTESGGVLAAFSFEVAAEPFTGETVCWLDYALTTAEGEELTQTALLASDSFQKPTDVEIASVEQTGYAITGLVTSYNAANPITYALYKMGDDGNYEETAAYTGIAVEAITDGTTAGQHTQEFEITGVEEGTYKLVIEKTGHLDFTVNNIEVSADVDLAEDMRVIAFAKAREVNSVEDSAETADIWMCPGDVNNDGAVGFEDSSVVFTTGTFNTSDVANSTTCYQNADINGDNTVGFEDSSIIFSNGIFNKISANYIIN